MPPVGITTPSPARDMDYHRPVPASPARVAVPPTIAAPASPARIAIPPPVAVPPPVGTAAAAWIVVPSATSCSCHVFSPSSPWIARQAGSGSQCHHQSRIAAASPIRADAVGTHAAAGCSQSCLLPLGPKNCYLLGRHPAAAAVRFSRPPPPWIATQTLHLQNRCHSCLLAGLRLRAPGSEAGECRQP